MKKEEKNIPTKALTPMGPTNLPFMHTPGFAPFFATSPFRFMRRFADDMERMFDEFPSSMDPLPLTFWEREFPTPKFTEFQKTMWAPQIEVLENEKTLTVRADLPGLNKEDINVEIKDDFLVISGERKLEEEEKKEGFYRSERNYGSFYRALPLPEGAKMDNAKATFVNGVLEIKVEVPAALHKGRKLEISTTPPPQAKAAGR